MKKKLGLSLSFSTYSLGVRASKTYHRIMNIRSPDARKKQKSDMGKVVARDKKQSDDIWAGLQNAIERIEGNRCPRCQHLWRLVLMMQLVHIFIQKLICVERSVHPVNANFDYRNVESQVS